MGSVFTELELHTSVMKFLLVCTVIASASAAAQYLPSTYGYGLGLHTPYGYGLGVPATYNVIKPVVKEIEVPFKTFTYSAKDTGCKNVFGLAVPCLKEGEADRRKRSAEEVKEAAPAAVLPYAGLGYTGLGYGGLGYAGLGYAGLGHAVTYTAPKINEIEVEVPQIVYKQEVQNIELAPGCNNGYGFPVPCL